ncbi:MAG: cell division protein ZapA [Elusimicrobiota bacterium]
MKSLHSDRVRVQIFGREYEMDSGGLTPLELQSIAGIVDEKMREIADNSGIVDTQKVAVLAAVNIAFEYQQMRENSKGSISLIEPQLERLDKVLVEAISK